MGVGNNRPDAEHVVIPGHKKISALVLQDCVTTRAGATQVAQDSLCCVLVAIRRNVRT